ncbi:Putative adenylate cyclase [gamma proteobacterium HdN1]|nr:Putative adenylate cyclase [gamma proteobacterium HdN1]
MRRNLNLDFNPIPLVRQELSPHWVRLMGYGFGVLVFSLGIGRGFFPESLWWVLVIAFFYPLISFAASKRFREHSPNETLAVLIIIDCNLVGGSFVLMRFNPFCCLLLFLVMSTATMVVGGLRGWSLTLVSMVVGVVLALLIFGMPTPLLSMPDALTVTVLAITCSLIVTLLGFFSHRQARHLMDIQEELATSQQDAAQLSRKLTKYLSPQIWGAIFSGEADAKLQTRRKQLSIFFSDIRGFTEITEELQPEALTSLLNSYFTEMSKIALKYGGTIDKFIGDAIMIFFGDPNTRGFKADAVACVCMAIEMRKRMKTLKQTWARQGITKPLQVRIGVNSGYCTVGNFGAETRMDYTIVGKEVNLASRLESLARTGEILIAEPTYQLVRDVVLCRNRGEIDVKGFSRPVPIYEVVDLRRDLGAVQSYMEYETQGFALFLDIDKIHHYDKDKVVTTLEEAARRVREKLIV